MVMTTELGGNKPLLVIDKNRNLLDLLSIMFRHEGYHTTCCVSGQTGLEQITDQSIPVILSDTQLPDMCGKHFLADVKKVCRNSKVAMMSIDPYNHRQFELIGALDFVEKPISRQELIKTMSTLEKERRYTRRFDCRIPVTINQDVPATSVNFSSDGMLFKSAVSFAGAQELRISIKNQLSKKTISAAGKVIRSDRENGDYLTALYFHENIGHQVLDNIDYFDTLV